MKKAAMLCRDLVKTGLILQQYIIPVDERESPLFDDYIIILHSDFQYIFAGMRHCNIERGRTCVPNSACDDLPENIA